MNGQPTAFWPTLWLLLKAARKRAVGRQKRQAQLFQHRARKRSFNWPWLGFGLSLILMALVHGLAAFMVLMAVSGGQRVDAERHGKTVVDTWFLDYVRSEEADGTPNTSHRHDSIFASEASLLARRNGGSQAEHLRELQAAVDAHGSEGLVATGWPGGRSLLGLPRAGPISAMLGSAVLFAWFVMLVCQGEGLELDLQRRRHPMWEWLFSHPVTPGAVFLAEMLSPIAANPVYCVAPLFTGILYGLAYGRNLGIAAALLAGIPIAVAAACVGKALEIGITLRFSPRSRGAMIGLMSWLGYALMMAFFLGMAAAPTAATVIGRTLAPLAGAVPWPWLGWFLGSEPSGAFSFPLGMIDCWAASGLAAAGAVWFAAWGASQGLSGNFGGAGSLPSVAPSKTSRFERQPLYRKEVLWFMRDRSALVQAILIPLTIAAIQLFNLRGFLRNAQASWNSLCGAGILFGTYFLWVLGPRSLASEGAALWLTLTWPHGLEGLLKAKARLWSLLAGLLVLPVFAYAAFQFPDQCWKVLLAAAGWLVFSRSMGEKSVTLVTVTSASGEPERIPAHRRWAAALGMTTFAIGMFTGQWQFAVAGIVYSYMTAAAMWQNLRARLPYLYDPWSETLPAPPTLMHAMIAISSLVEGGAVLSGIAIGLLGHSAIAVARVIAYGVCATLVSVGFTIFLSRRGVAPREVWSWNREEKDADEPWFCGDGSRGGRFAFALSLGALGGLALAVFALGYQQVLLHIPYTAGLLRTAEKQIADMPHWRLCYGIAAVAFAPFAEEYLFRGLLFRALDREWGGWRAVLGSAAFFAIYHPPLAWLPVFLVGTANALLFKKTGRLAPAVLLHMVYNAVVVWPR